MEFVKNLVPPRLLTAMAGLSPEEADVIRMMAEVSGRMCWCIEKYGYIKQSSTV